MKIGFSLGQCTRDIANDKVNIDDVAFIIASTNIRDKDHLSLVIEDYTHRSEYLFGLDYKKCLEIANILWDSNRLLQPRRQGMHKHMQPTNSVWVDIFPTAFSENESVTNAWNTYRFMLHMVENVDNEAF